MTLTEKLKESMKEAMRAKDKVRLGTVRLALSAIKQIEVDERKVLSDEDVLAVLTKMVKQRKDSVSQYVEGGRQDLADIELAEISVIQNFLPAAMSESDIEAIVEQAIADSDAKGMQEMGKVMALVKPKAQGRADMGLVSKIVKAKLTA